MGRVEPASIVIITFPFSDLSGSKQRPAVILADAGRGDWVMCQITSVTQGDVNAIPLLQGDITAGKLETESVVRPLKLFTGNQNLIVKRIAILKEESFRAILAKLVRLLGG